ncbi:MAG: hydrogenase expression/formation protein HypE [Candidatus Eremiobacteraeota bacterium]|jgi:hydrogenase expression/formation protein HypE|nr:hydrogenase expression/formation protein HypE [Candidatus Eremiobacteraeota bacterium]
MTTAAAARPRLRFSDSQIEMAHGAGGKASRRLVEGLIAPAFANPVLAALSDAAVFPLGGARVATTADGYVVRPLRFPGGSIGDLAVNGTVNDLAVSGARAVALMASFILEAGLPADELRAEVEAMAAAARRAGVPIVGGDTKVVEHGRCDGMYVTTFGVGLVDERLALDPRAVRAGDAVLVSGPIGDHGITILLARGELELEADLRSDTRSVWPFVESLIAACASGLRWMRDPTRGGVATALNELARECELGIVLREADVPLRREVRGACEVLGLDPLHIANEGQLLAVVAPADAERALAALQAVPGGEGARLIGEVRAEHAGTVVGITPYGGTRAIDMLVGDPLPRIC